MRLVKKPKFCGTEVQKTRNKKELSGLSPIPRGLCVDFIKLYKINAKFNAEFCKIYAKYIEKSRLIYAYFNAKMGKISGNLVDFSKNSHQDFYINLF